MLKNNGEKIDSTLLAFTPQFRYFFIVLTLFSSTWLISNIVAIKLISIFGIILTGGFIIFPLTTLLGNVIVEVYGYKNSRQAIWAGIILNFSFIFFINLINVIPSSPYWELNDQFRNILIPETRIILASLVSFSISDFSNSYCMAKLKIKNDGKSLIKRIIFSSGLSISVDIIFFMILAFAGTIPTILLFKLMTGAYFKKILCQIILLPLIWYLSTKLKIAEGLEVYDYDTKFNPFSMENIYEINSIKQYNTHNKKTNFSNIA